MNPLPPLAGAQHLEGGVTFKTLIACMSKYAFIVELFRTVYVLSAFFFSSMDWVYLYNQTKSGNSYC